MMINERSTGYITAAFKDKSGAAAEPLGVTYRIDCLATGAVVRGWTVVAPASSVEIVLTPSDTTMLGSSGSEPKRVTIVASYGLTDTDMATEQIDFTVKRLTYVKAL